MTEDIHPEAKKRVERGAELLDDLYGDEWREAVNPEVLDMAECTHCVLGQSVGHFLKGLRCVADKTGMSRAEITHAYGFDAVSPPADLSGSDGIGVRSKFYEELEKAWLDVLDD